jgi:two-component system sensor histidine kinase GlrK
MFQARSILQLVLVGFLVVLLPVLGALLYGARALSTMAKAHRDHLVLVSDSAEQSQRLAKGLVDLERLARQYNLLFDASLLGVFNNEAVTAIGVLKSLQSLRPEPDITRTASGMIEQILALQRGLNSTLDPKPSPEQKENVAQALLILPSLSENMQTLRFAMEQDLKQKVSLAKDIAQTTQSRLLILGFTVLPGTLLLVGLFSILITRPVKAIDRRIKQIGTGSYENPRRITGPRDLQIVAERLNWLGQRLRASEEAQERFLRHISHELKTPLATIKEGIELLADGIPGPLNQRQTEVLSILQSGVQHFQVLINNLLDFNLLRSNKPLIREQVSLKELIAGIVRLHQLTAERKSVQFELSGDEIILRVDRSVISAAIDNLVSNALHFSPEGGRIRLSWQKGAEGLSMTVTDEGPGIASEEREKVFLPFYQGKAMRVGPLKGTGLGLSVARECVELHKGQLRILDAERGARLELNLPHSVLVGGR